MNTKFALLGIESKAGWLRYYIGELEAMAGRLAFRRSFQTRAEDDLEELERLLTDTLERVRKVRADVAAKSVNDKAA